MERQGLISRFFSRTASSDRDERTPETAPAPEINFWGDNARRPVHELV